MLGRARDGEHGMRRRQMLSAGAALVLERALAAGGVGGALGLLARRARAETPPSSELVQHDLELEGDRRIARRALVLEPAQRSGDGELSILILLHGLGEMGNETLGIHAWGERYGLVRAYERLRPPPDRKSVVYGKIVNHIGR